jgi:pyrroline-5-carboxylate reductase
MTQERRRMKLGFIGTGTITSAVVHGLAGRGHRITVSERGAEASRLLAERYAEVARAPNQAVIDGSDVVFLGLMSEAAAAVLEPLRFRPGQGVISFMAGTGLDALAKMVAPARAEAIVLPFPSIAGGGSPLVCLGARQTVDLVFGETEEVIPLASDSELNAYLCAQAVLSPVTRLVGDAAKWLAEQGTDAARAEAFLRALVVSNLAQSAPDALIEALNAEGGFNQRLRLHMEASGLRDALRSGLDSLASETSHG